MSNAESLHICFVAHFAYGAMAGGNGGHIGGVDRQVSLMARWFAGRGHQVSMLTWDEGQEDGVEIDGVRVHTICRADAGLPGLRFLRPRWTGLVAAMKRADAHIYYQNCAECVTGQVALWCRRHRRKFVYSVASDPDCDRRLPEIHRLRERVLYRYGVRAADRIIVQTAKQRDMLKDAWQRESIILPMPCPGPSQDDLVDLDHERRDAGRVLWVGRIREVKRPDRLLDLAELCPDVRFDLVGPEGSSDYARSVCQRAKSISNVTVHGAASRERVSEFYRKAAVLCCTSDYEGFPNTFIEAWSYGLPIVSTVDPDDLIAERGFGRVAKDVPGLAAGIQEMLHSPEQWRKASQSTREHYLANHLVDTAMGRFERVFSDLF